MTFLWIFAIFDAGALAMAAAELRARHSLAASLRKPWPAWASIALLIVTHALQIALTYATVTHQPWPIHAPRFVPVPPAPAAMPHADAVAAATLGLTALQCVCLLQLYRGRPSTAAIVAGSATLAAMSWLCPVLPSGDAYAYIGYALLGSASYAPPATPFTGDLAAIGTWWGTPMPPSPYGPVMLAATTLVTGAFPSLLGKIAALRTFDVLVFGALIWCLHALGLPRRVTAIAALNPGLLLQYVEGAHNDLFGIVLALAGAVLLRRTAGWRTVGAFAAMTASGLVKLPFAIFVLPLLSSVRPAALRVALAIAVPAAALACTLLAAGKGIVFAARPHLTSSGLAVPATALVALAALAAIVAAVAGKRRLLSVVWLIPLTTSYACPWYLAWSLPYAAARRRIIGYLLVAFPLAATLLDVKFMRPWTLFAVVPAIVALQAIGFAKGAPRRE